jgi:hypothetical protein
MRPEPRFSFLTSAFLDHGYDRPFALPGHHQNLLDLAIYQQDAVGTLADTEAAPLRCPAELALGPNSYEAR